MDLLKLSDVFFDVADGVVQRRGPIGRGAGPVGKDQSECALCRPLQMEPKVAPPVDGRRPLTHETAQPNADRPWLPHGAVAIDADADAVSVAEIASRVPVVSFAPPFVITPRPADPSILVWIVDHHIH